MPKTGGIVADIADIRRRARTHLEQGAKTAGYQGDAATAITLLNDALATELVCVLRYKFHAIMAQGVNSESVRQEFEEHAAEEQQHMQWLASRIHQLGGKPDLNPANVSMRAASEYVEGDDMLDMIRENLVAERIAIDTYRGLIEWFGERDPTTRTLLEKILAKEEEHANDMHDLLAAHEASGSVHN